MRALQRVLAEAVVRHHTRLPAYCLMPNHFHVLHWPREGGDLSRFMSWLTITHIRRWTPPPNGRHWSSHDRGRFKSFPVQSDEHFLKVYRDVERNALSANCWGAEDWRWGILGVLRTKDDADRPALTPWAIDQPRDWTDRVNRPFGPEEEEVVRRSIELLGGVWRVIGGGTKEEEAMRRSIQRGQPYGSPSWQAAVARPPGLESVFRRRGRPRKEPPTAPERFFCPKRLPDPFSAPARRFGSGDDGQPFPTVTRDHFDALAVATLPDHHRDPFDRLLIAQARHEGFKLVGRDPHLPRYGMPHIVA